MLNDRHVACPQLQWDWNGRLVAYYGKPPAPVQSPDPHLGEKIGHEKLAGCPDCLPRSMGQRSKIRRQPTKGTAARTRTQSPRRLQTRQCALGPPQALSKHCPRGPRGPRDAAPDQKGLVAMGRGSTDCIRCHTQVINTKQYPRCIRCFD